jgi:hypothetical protein
MKKITSKLRAQVVKLVDEDLMMVDAVASATGLHPDQVVEILTDAGYSQGEECLVYTEDCEDGKCADCRDRNYDDTGYDTGYDSTVDEEVLD